MSDKENGGSNVVELGTGQKPLKPVTNAPAHMEMMNEARRQRIRERGETRRAGRPPKVTVDDVRKKAVELFGDEHEAATLQQLLKRGYRDEAVAALVNQLRSKDESISQRAALRLLEITDGKPGSVPPERPRGPAIVEYRTAALGSEESADELAFEPGYGLD